MSQKRYTLDAIAEELKLPFESIAAARHLLPVDPVDRSADGAALFDKAALSKFFRLLVERDAAVLFEPRDPDAALRYLKSQLSPENFARVKLIEPTAEDLAFAKLVQRDPEAAEAQLNAEVFQ